MTHVVFSGFALNLDVHTYNANEMKKKINNYIGKCLFTLTIVLVKNKTTLN